MEKNGNTISKTFRFSMGHCLHYYKGNCHNLHGHNYRFVLEVTRKADPITGMVVDFSYLKQLCKITVLDLFDHAFLVNKKDPRSQPLKKLNPSAVIMTPYEPTAENILTDILTRLEVEFNKDSSNENPLAISKGILWETDDSYAVYENR